MRDWWATGRFLVVTDDAYVKGDITAIVPKLSGYVKEVRITDDEQVHAGDLLVQLDTRDYEIRRRRALATITAGGTRVAAAKAAIYLQDSMEQQAQAELLAAQAEAERARADAHRYEQLQLSRNTSEQRFEQVDSENKKAQAMVMRARASIEASRRRSLLLGAQEAEEEASVAQAKVELAGAELDLSYCDLRSPIDGTVDHREARVGAFATAGSQLLSIVPSEGLWIEANFKETQIVGMRTGQAADLEIDGMPGIVLAGRVHGIAPASGAEFAVLPTENATGNFTKIVQRIPVRIDLDGSPPTLADLRPGMSVIVRIYTRDRGPVGPGGPRLQPRLSSNGS